jgi:O-antigen/teichoic acid export membrane protein
MDRVMIGFFWDAKEVAIYWGGQRFSQYLIQIPTGLAMILFPTISFLDSKGKGDRIKLVVHSSERLIAMAMAPICAITFVLAIPIVTILGDLSYKSSFLVLQPLAIWAFFRAITTPYGRLIMGIGKPKINAIVSVIGIATMVLFNLIFIPADIKSLGIPLLGMKAMGAAYATLISGVIVFLLFQYFAFRYRRLVINPGTLWFVGAGILTGAVLYAMQRVIPADRIFTLLLYGINGMLIYLLILFLTKSITKEDMALFQEIMNPLKMIRYIYDEFRNGNRGK